MAFDASPAYSAVIEWVPVMSLDVVIVATPPLSVPEPMGNDQSKNLTLPVTGGPEVVTVAVKVTESP